MIKYPQMKFAAAVLVALLVHASTFAGARVVVSSLPEPVRPLAEVETNVFFDAGAAADNKWMLTIERDAAASNSVEVVFGRDANEDGVLGIEEGELSVGWDCGEWFWRDRRENAFCRAAGSGSHLDWTLRLGRNRAARALSSTTFPDIVAPTCFNPEWDTARVVARGAETVHMVSARFSLKMSARW